MSEKLPRLCKTVGVSSRRKIRKPILRTIKPTTPRACHSNQPQCTGPKAPHFPTPLCRPSTAPFPSPCHPHPPRVCPCCPHSLLPTNFTIEGHPSPTASGGGAKIPLGSETPTYQSLQRATPSDSPATGVPAEHQSPPLLSDRQ